MLAVLTMLPLPASSIRLPNSRQHQNTPSRFTPITAFQSSSGVSSAGVLRTIPALLTRMCTLLSFAARSRTAPESVTFSIWKLPPMLLAAASPTSGFRSAMMTFAPASLSPRAISKPMPCAAPVTSAVFPSNLKRSRMVMGETP